MKKNISTNELLNERFSQLPEIIQDIILDSNWKAVIRRITETYSLHIDQGGYLEAVTLLTMLGLEESEDYIKNIQKEVNITEPLAKEIAVDIEKNIFQKIREKVIQDTTKEKSIEVIKERTFKDPYREDIDIIDQQKEAEEKEKKEDREALAQNIDLLEKKEPVKGEEIVDRDDLLKEIEDDDSKPEEQSLPKANTGLQKEIDTTDKDINKIDTHIVQEEIRPKPVHMRTLKSDIVKEKLENPTWVPKIARKEIVSDKTKTILNSLGKENNNK
jgi:hypothetical protein